MTWGSENDAWDFPRSATSSGGGGFLNSRTLAVYARGGTMTRAQVTSTITAATWTSGTATLTLSGNNANFTSNTVSGTQQAVVENVTPSGYNGTFDVTASGSNQLTYAVANPGGSGSVFGDVYSTCNMADMETLIGSPIYGAMTFCNSGVNADNWADWELPNATNPLATAGAALQTWQQGRAGRNVIVTMALLPTSITGTTWGGGTIPPLGSSGWIAQAAANAVIDDATTPPATIIQHATHFGNNLVAAGYPRAIIRIAAEMNGDSNPDSLGPTSSPNFSSVVCPTWAQAFANIVRGLRLAAGQKFLIDWCPNQNFQNIAFNLYYPGNGFVDIIGLDAYDNYGGNPATQPSRWNVQPTIPSGINAIISFAQAQGKPNSFPEWGLDFNGVYNPPTNDDPTFVAGMLGVVAANNFTYQCYFNNTHTGTPQMSTDVPLSLAAYQAACGPGGYIPGRPW